MIVFLSILASYWEARVDVKLGDKHDLRSKLGLSLTIALFFIIPFLISGSLLGSVIYVCVRFAIFDYLYSYMRFKTLFYLGETSDTDGILKRVPKAALITARVLSLSAGVLLELNNIF